MGIVINPEGATIQMEGCITMDWATPCRKKSGSEAGRCSTAISTPMSCLASPGCPRSKRILVKNDELIPQGGGEPAIVPMGAVVANAIFDATGARLFRLPLTPTRVREAIEKT